MLVKNEIASDEVMFKAGLHLHYMHKEMEVWADKINSLRIFREFKTNIIKKIFVLGESKEWYCNGIHEEEL